MEISLEFDGLKELAKAFDKLANNVERLEVDKKIVKQCGQYAQPVMQKEIPRSRDNSKSGRKLKGGGSSRPKHGHAADNVPVSNVKIKNESAYAEVGWDLSDNSEYFYMKFVNWGTTKITPTPFVERTISKCDPEWEKIAEQEYQKFIRVLEG